MVFCFIEVDTVNICSCDLLNAPLCSLTVSCWLFRAESSLNMFPETRTLFLKTPQTSFQMKHCTQKREADVSTQHTQLWYEHHHMNVIKILFMNLLASWGHVTCSNVFIKYCNIFGELCSISGCDFMGYTEFYCTVLIYHKHILSSFDLKPQPTNTENLELMQKHCWSFTYFFRDIVVSSSSSCSSSSCVLHAAPSELRSPDASFMLWQVEFEQMRS